MSFTNPNDDLAAFAAFVQQLDQQAGGTAMPAPSPDARAALDAPPVGPQTGNVSDRAARRQALLGFMRGLGLVNQLPQLAAGAMAVGLQQTGFPGVIEGGTWRPFGRPGDRLSQMPRQPSHLRGLDRLPQQADLSAALAGLTNGAASATPATSAPVASSIPAAPAMPAPTNPAMPRQEAPAPEPERPLSSLEQWLLPMQRQPGTNFTGPIGPGLPSQRFVVPGTGGQNLQALVEPEAAVAHVLRQRGYDPGSPVGQLYRSMAKDLRRAYELSFGQTGEQVTAESYTHPAGFLTFLHGYVDRMEDASRPAHEDLTAMRGVLRAQVHEAVHNPASAIYREMEAAREDHEQRDPGNGDEVYWYGLIRPALQAIGVTPNGLGGAYAQFQQLRREHAREAIARAGTGERLSFVQYLAERGYRLPA